MKSHRPFGVTLMSILVFIVTGIHLSRFILVVTRWDFLTELLPISPLYLALSGLIWSLVCLPLCWGLWRAKNWAPRIMQVILLVYSAYYWVDRYFLPGYAGRNVNWLFALSVNLLILVWSVWALSRPRAKEYFGVMYEQ